MSASIDETTRRGRTAAWRWILLGLVILSLACRRERLVVKATYPRYWLHGVDASGLAQPTDLLLVELLPDGRLRSVVPGRPWEGRLPDEVSSKPTWGHGLALYVNRTTDFHYGRPEGPLLGRVLAGTLVSVAIAAPAAKEVAVALWNDQRAYVDATALGITVPPVANWTPPPGARSALGRVQSFGNDAPGTATDYFELAACEPIFVGPNYQGTQFVRGFEVRAHLTGTPMTVDFESTRCPAKALTWNDDGGYWIWSGGARHPQPSTELPVGFARIDDKAADVVADTLRRQGSFVWLHDTLSGITCDSWHFHARSDSTGELVRDSDPRETHALTFRKAFPDHPATLFLNTLESEHHWAFKCDCSVEYSVVGTQPGEVAMLARPLPTKPIGYVPGEAERWFLSAQACETARKKIADSLASDPTKAASVGFHADEVFQR